MTRVWLVETGEYEDATIVAAFTTEEKAEAYCKAYNESHSCTYCYQRMDVINDVELDPDIEEQFEHRINIHTFGECPKQAEESLIGRLWTPLLIKSLVLDSISTPVGTTITIPKFGNEEEGMNGN